MEFEPYHIESLCKVLELLGFFPETLIGDSEQIKYVHPTKERTSNHYRNYIMIPQMKSANKRFCSRVLNDLDDFGFTEKEIISAAKKANLIKS